MARAVAQQFEIGLIDPELRADIRARVHDVDSRNRAGAGFEQLATRFNRRRPKPGVERGVVDLADMIRKAAQLHHGRFSRCMS